LSSEVYAIGPESVKNKQLFFSLKIIEFGPSRGAPSKSLITGVISQFFSSMIVFERTA